MCITSILFKMDSFKSQLGLGNGRWRFVPVGGFPMLLLYGVLMIMVLTPERSSVEGYRVQKRETNSCYYNGTHFMEGSIVPTKEPCLMCKCQSKTLICALKVCPEQPIPPPRGCILVHKSGYCCPYLQCSKLHLATKNSGDRKKIHFLDYYEKEAQDRLSNPNSYLQRSDDDDVEENGACIVNGTVYKSGSAMTSSSLCSYCYCINGRQKCVKPQCALPNPRCAPVFIDSACCPIRYDCSGKTPVKEEASTESPNLIRRINNRHYLRTVERKGVKTTGCAIDGKTYPEGERINNPDPCQVCFCIRGAPKCTPKKCAPAIKGCTPRVPRGECCAVRYDCSKFSTGSRVFRSSVDNSSTLVSEHTDQKRLSSRKIEEEEEEPFDFFSILFGPDPDEPKLEAKNATEMEVTEATPVISTSEKSFFDFLKAGLEFIDSNSDDLLETTVSSVSTEITPSTEGPVEVHTVRVEIVREPQTVYIEKPDFNFPVRTTLSPIKRNNSTRKPMQSTTESTTTTSPSTTAPTTAKASSSTITSTTNIVTNTTTTTPSTTTVSVSTEGSTEGPTERPTEGPTESPIEVPTESTTVVVVKKEIQKIPVAIELTKAEPEFQDLESDSLLKENLTDVSNALTDLESSEEYSDSEELQTSAETSTVKSVETETPNPTTTDSAEKSSSEDPIMVQVQTTVSPIDVVIKVDDSINSPAVESILSSLKAKIEKVEPATTTIATKRPNNKFVGFELEKVPTTVTSTTTAATVAYSMEEVTTDRGETTTVRSVAEPTTTETDDSVNDSSDESTVDYKNDEMLVEDWLSTVSSVETTSTDQPEMEPTVESTTADSYEMTSTVVSPTVADDDVMEFKSESETEHPDTEQKVVQTTTELSVTTTTQKVRTVTPKNTTKPLATKENNLLSVLLTELSNIFDSTRNDSGKQNAKNRTEYRPVTPKPIPIGEFHQPSSIPSILESDIDLDYSEPTLPPSLPNLKIIPFLPADAVKKNEAPIPLAAPYDFYKPNPTNYPIITESYEPYGVLADHEIHPGMPFKPPKYDYSYDQSLGYSALTENYGLDAKSNNYNTKIIRNKYDTIADTDYEYETDALAKYEAHANKELFKNELKKFIPTKYEVPQEGTYIPVYDKYGVGYPEKNVYYSNHKETYEPVVYNSKKEMNTEHPLFKLEEPSAGSSGFSPPTKTEGGFLPKDQHFYYEPYVTTSFPIDVTTDATKDPYNTTASTFGATLANPFIDVIHPEPAPPLMSLIEDKEKLFSVYHSVAKNNHSSLDDLLDNDTVDSSEYDKQIISITTDANYLSTMGNSLEEVNEATSSDGASALPLRGGMDYTSLPMEMETTQMLRNSTEPEPNGMFSLENVLNYLFRDEEQMHDNVVKNVTTNPGLMDGVPPFKTIPSHLGSVYSPPTSIEASLGDVQHHAEAEEQHDGTVTLKVESELNGTKDLYRPSLMDLPFLNPNFHSPSGSGSQESELKNDIDRFGFDPDTEHYQVISDGPPNTIPNSETYVVNPVDINKLKQHHSEGTAEITMKSKVYSLKDTVGILKLAGCNIYGRMYRVGRIISELSGPCLECKCTEVGVHCTPLSC